MLRGGKGVYIIVTTSDVGEEGLMEVWRHTCHICGKPQ